MKKITFKYNAFLLFLITVLLFQFSCKKGDNPVIDPTPVVTIGFQVWTQNNLDVRVYRNGDPIPQVTDPTVWGNLTTGAWCWYNNDSATNAIYGKLYNWYAVNDSRGLAPSGYHIATDAEWTQLTDFLGGAAVAAGKIRTTSGWTLPNTGATNSTGFSSLPGGYRNSDGTFRLIGGLTSWWSSTETNTTNAWSRIIGYNNIIVGRGSLNKTLGNSVRCVRN